MDKHKWNKEIIAWANGDEIECRLIDFNATSNDWGTVYHPQWDNPSIEFRIKQKDEIITIEIGKFYKTRCGYKVIIYAIHEQKEWYKNIHGAFLNGDSYVSRAWYQKGNFLTNEEYCLDIVSEWVEPHPAESWEVDKKILVSDNQIYWYKKYFAKFENGYFYAWYDGRSSWNEKKAASWKYAKPAEEE